MKMTLQSTLAAVTLICLAASAPAKAQNFFPSAYARPVEMVDGIQVGTRFDSGPKFASTTALAAQNCPAGIACRRRYIVH